MDPERRGWVAFLREWLDDPIINKDADHLALWIYLVANAVYKPTHATLGGKQITLQPGQFATGRKRLSANTGIEESKITRTLNELQNAHLIEQQTTNKNRLISIPCWASLQNDEHLTERQNFSNMNTDKQDILYSPYGEYCPERKRRDAPRRRKAPEPFSKDHATYKAARWMTEQIAKRVPSRKPFTEKDIQRWAQDIDKLNRIDGYRWDKISDVLSFSQEDKFWQRNILSGEKLRKQFDTLLAQMPKEDDHAV